MKDVKPFTQYQHRLKAIAPKYWIIGGVLLGAVLVYSFLFFVPKQVQLAYAGESCAKQLVLFPSIQTPVSDDFTVTVKDELRVGSFAYAATRVCAEPKVAPSEGEYVASIKPFNGAVWAKPLSIKVSEPPGARTDDLAGKTISTALPLKVQLTSPDTLHTYELSVEDKKASCATQDAQLLCNISDLELNPGSHYTASLLRSYKGGDAAKLIEGRVETLLPIVLQDASITDKQTIYDSPKQFNFRFDRPLESAKVTLVQKSSETATQVQVTEQVSDTVLTISTEADLERKAEFTLTIEQAIADNGSSLETPVVVDFATSGGPKPASVSVGASNVPQAAQIVVTLDQPLKEDIDIAKFARVTGVSGSVRKQSETQLVFAIQGGLCQAFSLVIDEGVASASNTAVSEAWKFDSRTVCGTTSVIGYSVQGRPIIAYYFGNGSSTILFTGGIHGEERSAQQTMQAWADYLMTNAYKIPADKRVVVVPNLNPDGIATGTRNNVNNVNLGRNYPSNNWKASIETASGVLPTGGGTEAGSEPETKAIMALTQQLRPRLEISFHAQGRLVGANKVGDSVSIGNIYASTVGYGTMFHNAEEVMGYTITGEYEEWMGEKLGIPAILIELPSRNGNYLNSQLNALMKMLAV